MDGLMDFATNPAHEEIVRQAKATGASLRPKEESEALTVALDNGVVSVRPSMQVFRNDEGVEGFNAVVRIDDQKDPGRAYYLWMDQISEVLRLGSD